MKNDDGDDLKCADIDECLVDFGRCNKYATCNNTEGSFDCSCLPGFQGDGFYCEGTLYFILINNFMQCCMYLYLKL